MLSHTKKQEFITLYQEFAQTYLPSKTGKEHIAFYQKGREQARENFDQIVRAAEQGAEITDAVLLKLLPYANTSGNRKRGAWIHVGPSITKDLKEWYENAGWTKPEDWPHIAEAILKFVLDCIAEPKRLPEACREFSNLPYSKGFQSGSLSPILNALRPDAFILINNKSRGTLNYLADANYDRSLTSYPELNTKAKALIDEMRHEIRTLAGELGVEVRDSDLFDMFSHWMVGVKKFFKPQVLKLAAPFSEMFADWDEAVWAFDLLEETAKRLGVQSPDNPLAAFTLRKRSGETLIRLSYGNWLVLGFAGRSKSLTAMTMALFPQGLDLEPIWVHQFTQTDGEPAVHLYHFPIDTVRPFEDKLRDAFHNTLDYLFEKFEGWQGSPFHHRTNPEVAGAVFDPEKRTQLLRGGIRSVEEDEVEGEENSSVEEAGVAYKAKREPEYWKIAPGENARFWPKWRDEGCISIGWDEMGDLTGVSREAFESTLDEALEHNPTWTKEGCEQVWKFLNLQVGDRIVANRGISKVLGIGTVTGPCYYVEADRHRHRIPVQWDDLTVRKVNEPGWRRAMVKLSAEKFERICEAPEDEVKKNPVYSIDQCMDETGFPRSMLASWVKAIERKGQAVIYGPPGTGKTYIAEKLAQHLIGGSDGFTETVQFHPAYAYEDFIQGIRPRTRSDGGLEYPMLPGRFLQFCERTGERDGCCVLIVDEINRANLARVFGELMYLLEYRDKAIPLAGGDEFQIPSNVRIIGTMNTADRSIALVDHALRRRFAFLELYPDMGVLQKYHEKTGFPVKGLIEVLNKLNRRIDNPHYAVGISYFLRPDLPDQIEDIWVMEIEPYLVEYFFDHPEWAESFSWDRVKDQIMP